MKRGKKWPIEQRRMKGKHNRRARDTRISEFQLNVAINFSDANITTLLELTRTYLFDCLIKGLLLFAGAVELLLLSVTDLVGGCGGGPRFLVFSSAPLDVGVVFADAGFFLFFIIKCRDSSVLKSTAVPLLGAFVVFCGLFPVDDVDDGDSFVVGDVTPIAIANKKKKAKRF